MVKDKKRVGYIVSSIPTLYLVTFFLIPLVILLSISVSHRVPGAFYEPGFTMAHYARFISGFFGEILFNSILLSALASAAAILIMFPFTWILTRLSRFVQILILICILAVLSLSEVIVGFAWSTLLSKSAGISNLFVWLGIVENASSWTPSFTAVLSGLIYITLPYCFLVLFPVLSRIDPEFNEAAQTLGASPLKAFFTIIIPISRNAILASYIMGFVFTLGSFLIPNLLGRPQHWTLTVHITDQTIYQANMPFGSAMAMFLLFTAITLVWFSQSLLGKKE